MIDRSYQDFILFADDVTLDVRGAVQSFTVRVFDSPAGQSESKQTVRPPKRVFDDTLEFDHAFHLLRDGRWDQELDKQIELGQVLADLLLPSPGIRDLFYSSLDWVSDHGDLGLRVRLRLPHELSPLPWEYMHVQRIGRERRGSDFLALNPRVSIVRHEALPIPARWFEAGARQRILVVMATPDGYPRLRYLPEEQRLIRAALAPVDAVEVEYLPDLGNVLDTEAIPSAQLGQVLGALQTQTDILHFSGHGGFLEEAGTHGDTPQSWGSIVLATENNQPFELSADQLLEYVGYRGVRLVVLGACETAQSDPLHAWSGVAVSLLRGEIPAVVAMQFRIDDKLAALFMGRFYEVLAGGGTIDQAVFQGRQQMRFQMMQSGSAALDWVAPVLYLRTPGGCIFPPITDRTAREAAARRSADVATINRAWHSLTASGHAVSRGRTRESTERHAPLKLLSQTELAALAARRRDLGLQPVQALLLLRSAVTADTEEGPWLNELRTVEGERFIRGLDSTESSSSPPEEVQRLLGLELQPEEKKDSPVGPVARSAVHHPGPFTRRTAALALATLDPAPHEGLTRLDRALRAETGVLARWRRRSELWGTLADADPEVEKLNQKLPLLAQLGIWGWRVWRRVLRESEWLTAKVLCVTFWSGLLLGVWRGLLTLLAGEPWPVYFFIHSYLGALLGLFTALGIGLAKPTLLCRRSSVPASGRLARRAATLGTLFFAITHLTLAIFTLWQAAHRPWLPATGTLFGLGLCLALYGLPKPDTKLGMAGILLRLATAAAVACLAQALVLLIVGEQPYEASVINLAASERGRFYDHWFESLGGLDRYSGLDRLTMVLDTGATGMVLALGAMIGLTTARRVLDWWHKTTGAVDEA